MEHRYFRVDWDTCLGAGAEGEVYLGHTLLTDEPCAIKVSCLTDPVAAADQLGGELDACLRATNDQVVRVLGWSLAPPRPFLAFELAHAGSLSDEIRGVLQSGRVYAPVEALRRAREMLATMAQMHERGLIHRDIKPGNFLRFIEGMKVIDFGSGVTAEAAGAEQQVVGTRLYSAPEALAGQAVDDRADLYGVGCILHEMLLGRAPRRPGSIGLSSAPLRPELERVLDRLLAPQRDERPVDAREALAEVDAALRAYGVEP